MYLFNIDALESVVEENKQQREEEAKRAEPIIHEAIDEVLEKFSYLSVRPMMALLTDKADRIRRRELHRALANCRIFPDKERRIIDSMSRMIVRKMLREPMIHFNEIAGTQEEGLYWDLFKDMFNLEKEGCRMRNHIRIGTRKSALALWQSEYVKSELQRLYPVLLWS